MIDLIDTGAVLSPNFIFVSGSINPLKLDANDRRFTLLEITRSPLQGVKFKP